MKEGWRESERDDIGEGKCKEMAGGRERGKGMNGWVKESEGGGRTGEQAGEREKYVQLFLLVPPEMTNPQSG